MYCEGSIHEPLCAGVPSLAHLPGRHALPGERQGQALIHTDTKAVDVLQNGGAGRHLGGTFEPWQTLHARPTVRTHARPLASQPTKTAQSCLKPQGSPCASSSSARGARTEAVVEAPALIISGASQRGLLMAIELWAASPPNLERLKSAT